MKRIFNSFSLFLGRPNDYEKNRNYWKYLKNKLKKSGSELVSATNHLKITASDEARNAPTPITNYALFHDGEYVTNEQMNDTKFLKLVGK